MYSRLIEKFSDQFRLLGNCPPTPPLKPTLTLTSYLGQNDCLREGWVGSIPET